MNLMIDAKWADELWSAFLDKAPAWGMQIFGATLTLVIGLWVIKWITKGIDSYFLKHDFDEGLETFLSSLISVLLNIALVLTIAITIGMELTSFMAIFGSAGLAIGLALSGTLSNFAGGVMILFFKPYKVGDFIEAQGHAGKVSGIQIFNTILKTPDNKTIIIPNGGLATNSLINYSTEENRKLVMTFGIGYGDDVQLAKDTLLELMNADTRVLQEPDVPFVGLAELGDSSVNFTARAWVKGADYWGLKFDMNEKVYNVFAEKGLNIPYPQMDVHVTKG